MAGETVKIAYVIGTRPQIIKSAALLPALKAVHEVSFIDTGQHYDEDMAGAFFGELGLPRPDVSLGTTDPGPMASKLLGVLGTLKPDAVVAIGDTNSTYAAAISASLSGIPFAHVEAGLRSFDASMPEEQNRIAADRMARWCFAPTETAVAHLRAEGRIEGVELVGDVLQDVLAMFQPTGTEDPPALTGSYLFATIHRQSNRTPEAVEQWVALLGSLGWPVMLALHPGTRAALDRPLPSNVTVLDPQGYRDSLLLQAHAAAVLTDSGGISREAAWLGVPCLVLRTSSEWPETNQPVVGLNAKRAQTELDTLLAGSVTITHVRPSGASEAIAATLDRTSMREKTA